MMMQTPTNYDSLPGIPTVNAMPQGVPRGPWSALYRSAPGATLPSQAPMYNPGNRMQMSGAGFGAGMPVQIVGGLGAGPSTGKRLAWIGLNVAFAAGVGALYALARQSSRPVLFPAAVFGGVAAFTGLTWWLVTANGNSANGSAQAAA